MSMPAATVELLTALTLLLQAQERCHPVCCRGACRGCACRAGKCWMQISMTGAQLLHASVC